MARQTEVARDVWVSADPGRLQPGSLALAELAVLCDCGEMVRLAETFSPGTMSAATGLGEGRCDLCGLIWRVRLVVERRAY